MPAMAPSPAELEAICRRLGPPILRRCLGILRRDAEAEDAMQEVFVRLLTHADRIPPPVDQLRWCYTIATRVCLNRLRDGAARREAPTPAVEEQAAPPAGPEWVASRQLTARVLSQVDEDDAAVAWLVLVDGHTQEEAGALLALSRKTIGKRLARFLDAARAILGVEVA